MLVEMKTIGNKVVGEEIIRTTEEAIVMPIISSQERKETMDGVLPNGLIPIMIHGQLEVMHGNHPQHPRRHHSQKCQKCLLTSWSSVVVANQASLEVK